MIYFMDSLHCLKLKNNNKRFNKIPFWGQDQQTPTLQLCINYQRDAQIIIYSYNITFLYMFQAINAHLQEVTLYTCSIWYRHSLRAVVVADR
jgi:hypothetical protein